MVEGKEEDLQRMTDRLSKTIAEYGMKINTKKNDFKDDKQGRRRKEECANNNRRRRNRTGQQIFLMGSLISDDAKCHKEIKKRIAMGKEALTTRN